MKVLLDTHILLWVALDDSRLSSRARAILRDPDTRIAFSVVSVWEVAIKHALRRTDFPIPPGPLRLGALEIGCTELPVTAEHAIEVSSLSPVHGDPFDRMLVAQARAEGMALLSADRILWRYGDPVRRV